MGSDHRCSRHQNRTPANANFKRSGQALLNDFTMQFDDRATVNVSLNSRVQEPSVNSV